MSVGNGEEEEPQTSRHSCASCKHQRRRCLPGCIFAPHYPANRADYFREVHKIFGIKNMTHILEHLRPQDRKKAVESLEWEAFAWKEDPAKGPLGFVRKLEDEIELLKNQLIINNIPQQIMMPNSAGLIGFNHNSSVILAKYNSNLDVVTDFDYVDAHINSELGNYGKYLPRGEVENRVPDNYNTAVPYYSNPQGQGRPAMPMQDVVANNLPKQTKTTQRNHQTQDPVTISRPAASFINQGGGHHHQRGNQQAKFKAPSQGRGRGFPHE